jgi:subtilisin
MRRVLIATIFLILASVVVAGAFLPEGKAKEKARMPYVIYSTDPALKTSLKVRHTFPKAFTADLTAEEFEKLKEMGIKVERVKLYHILAPPNAADKCGDGVCQGFESPETCPADCSAESGSTERTCLPSDQTPWGIEKIYNDSSITVTTGGEGVDVAVLDTGVYRDHPDLKDRIKQCVDFTAGGPFKTRIMVGSCDDRNGHGTHVVGIISADGGADGLGIYGIAPEANIFAYKVCGGSGCWADDIAAAIRYATDNGAEIISMSLGGDEESSLIRDAIDYAVSHGVLVVAAAGNDGPAEGSIDYPAANANVIAVGAIDVYENVPDWSSRGINDNDYEIEEKEVEFGAPGVNIESTWNDGCYAVLDGTSMATPHVSGLAAKVWFSADLNNDGMVNATEVREYLHGLARDIWLEGDDPATGFGLPSLK